MDEAAALLLEYDGQKPISSVSYPSLTQRLLPKLNLPEPNLSNRLFRQGYNSCLPSKNQGTLR